MKLKEILELDTKIKTENIKVRGKEYKVMRYSNGITIYYNDEGILGSDDNFIDWGSLLSLYRSNTGK